MVGEKDEAWPALDWAEWHATGDTLHMLFQMVGKTRLALTPVQNHWWNVPLYLTARGLGTSDLPLADGEDLDVEFDFVDHRLVFRKSSGEIEDLRLESQTVAEFFAWYLEALKKLQVHVVLDPLPVEVKDPIRFDLDTTHKTYDPEAAHRFWRVLSRADRIFKAFSTGFYGKISPVHFFWGTMDLSVTRFNGRRAPARPGADPITAESYSHECINSGFWPGNGGYGKAAFFSYAAPRPKGLSETRLAGPGIYNTDLGEFVLDYDDVRRARDPDAAVLSFLQSTYSAAADASGWDRRSLDRVDRPPHLPPRHAVQS
jgi:hypothetical protein